MKASAAILMVCIVLAGCAKGPSEGNAEDAFLAYMKSTRSDDAALKSFKLGQCKEAQGQPGYNCAVNTTVEGMDGRFNADMSGVYTFGELDGKWQVLGVVSLSM